MQPLAYSRSASATCSKTRFDGTGWLLVGLLEIAVIARRRSAPLRALAAGRAGDRPRAIRIDIALHADPPAGPVPPRAVLHASIRSGTSLFGELRLPGCRPGTSTRPWRLVARRHRHGAVRLLRLPRRLRLRRLLAAPRPARPALVVGPAFAAPQPAADDDVERQPQPPARRPPARRRHRRAWRTLIGVAPGQFVAVVVVTQLLRKPGARQRRASASAPSLERAAGQPALSPAAPRDRPRPRVAAGRRRWAATTSRSCSRSGTSCSAPPTSRRASSRRACATSCPKAAGATTGAASGASSGSASKRMVGR